MHKLSGIKFLLPQIIIAVYPKSGISGIRTDALELSQISYLNEWFEISGISTLVQGHVAECFKFSAFTL